MAGVPDLGLAVPGEADHLGVATTLEIEDALITPAVLVVADQLAGRIGGEGGLAGARQPEEDRGVAGVADVGRAMHRQHRLLGEQVVQNREDRLFHLPGVAGPADQDHPLGKIEHDEGAGPGPVHRRIGLKLGGVIDHERRGKPGQFGRRGSNEHVPDEERLPGVRGDEPDREPVGRVGATEEVLDEDLGQAVQVLADVLEETIELVCREAVVLVPPDLARGRRLVNHELVFRRSTGVRLGDDGQRAMIGDPAFAPAGRMLVQARRAEVGPHGFGGDAVAGEIEMCTHNPGVGAPPAGGPGDRGAGFL